MKSFELAKEYLQSKQYKIFDEDGSQGYLLFGYQLNKLQFFGDDSDDNYYSISLVMFDDVTEENRQYIIEKCHCVNKDAKQVKMYIIDNVLIVAAEVYYLSEEDFKFQMKIALNNLVAAKVRYNKLDK